MAAVTAQLIHESPLSAGPITTFFFGRQLGYTCNNAVLHNRPCCAPLTRRVASRRKTRGRLQAFFFLSFFLFFPERSDSLVRSRFPPRNHTHAWGSLGCQTLGEFWCGTLRFSPDKDGNKKKCSYGRWYASINHELTKLVKKKRWYD